MAELTAAQRQTLKTYILAQPDFSTWLSNGQDNMIRAAMNLDANPVVLAWRTSVEPQSIDEAATYTAYDSLLAGKRDSWRILLSYPRDFTKNKVRNWITDVWGAATAGSNSESVLLSGTENASRAEAVFGGATKTTGTVSAIDRAWIGDLTDADIALILRG